MQDGNVNQLKLKVNDTYERDEKISTNFEHSNDEGVINKIYLDENLSTVESQISYREKYYNEFKLHNNNKEYLEENVNERAVKTTVQMFYDKGLSDNCNYGNAHEVLKDYLPIKVNDRCRPDLEEKRVLFKNFVQK